MLTCSVGRSGIGPVRLLVYSHQLEKGAHSRLYPLRQPIPVRVGFRSGRGAERMRTVSRSRARSMLDLYAPLRPEGTPRLEEEFRVVGVQVRVLTWAIGLIASIMVLTVGALVALAVRAAWG